MLTIILALCSVTEFSRMVHRKKHYHHSNLSPWSPFFQAANTKLKIEAKIIKAS
jgi:hypothetical protein